MSIYKNDNWDFESERFYYRQVCVEDANSNYLSWFQDENTSKYIISAESMQRLDDLKEYIKGKTVQENVYFVGIFTKRDKLHIGNLKYDPIVFQKKHAIVGMLIGNLSWQQKGVVKEAVLSSAPFVRDKYGINRILLGVDAKHTVAIRAYEKAGFKKVLNDPEFPDKETQYYMDLYV